MTEVLIDGSWRSAHSRAQQVVRNPATLQPVAVAPYCDAQDIVAAMSAARRALENWRMRPGQERTALLVEMGRQLCAGAPAIAELQAMESGQAYRECLDTVLLAARCFTQRSDSESIPASEARLSTPPALTVRPLVLQPEYPLLHWACCAARWLQEGSTLVCVAPHTAPLAVLRAAGCAAGLPPGVLNMLVASPEAVSAVLREAVRRGPSDVAGETPPKGTDAVFIGSTGESAVILAGAASLRLFHSGQRPGQSARIYVEQQRSHELADELHAYLAFLECGDPVNPATDLGPLGSGTALERVEDQLAGALRHGALLKVGGRRYQPWGLRGYFFQPTLMIEGRGDERVPAEEIPGPVVIISPVRNLAEALRQSQARRISFFGTDLDAQLRSLTAAAIDFEVGKPTAPLERIVQSFRDTPPSAVRIEPATSRECFWFPYGARSDPV